MVILRASVLPENGPQSGQLLKFFVLCFEIRIENLDIYISDPSI